MFSARSLEDSERLKHTHVLGDLGIAWLLLVVFDSMVKSHHTFQPTHLCVVISGHPLTGFPTTMTYRRLKHVIFLETNSKSSWKWMVGVNESFLFGAISALFSGANLLFVVREATFLMEG